MEVNGRMNGKSADQRHDEFAKQNAAWNRRVKRAVSELDKVAGKAKRGAPSIRRTPT